MLLMHAVAVGAGAVVCMPEAMCVVDACCCCRCWCCVCQRLCVLLMYAVAVGAGAVYTRGYECC